MNQQINAEIVKLVGNVPIPREVTNLASTLMGKAQTIPMKPNETPARMALCAHVAIEKLLIELQLPAPKQSQPPVPPRSYEKLLQLFREELLGAPPGPSTPRKRKSPMKNPELVAQRTPKTPRTARQVQKDIQESGRSDANVIGEDLLNSEAIGEEDGLLPDTPSKTKKSPQKSPRKGGPKQDDPQPADIEFITKELRFPKHALEGVQRGFDFYWALVKDRWGLLFGLLMTIAFHIQHRSFTDTEATREAFKQRALQLTRRAGMPEDRVEEWIGWTETILKDQMWVKILEQKSGIAPGVIQRQLDRQTSKSSFSGIGNMIPASFAFNSYRKRNDYHNWKASMLVKMKELKGQEGLEESGTIKVQGE
ncbi:origin recognition complex, subunit 6 [Yarrowia lipolytica]|uniref:YALI0F31647p n=2 Tax=Yarrowia lipolytica TaxID=4952 RepID=Q6BZQ7_YARLI|nr:YALI0F31647p [Yarrowia lipolytica CLIB122]AOW07968.1 hypothetical protein YALI1_F39261g [Yarrowia lipolytica]KAB8282356.1 origin recognition complex, subunit 6 [Yarrowia lipolytica]KAE8172258.1 origin recognition complex, subunit 6 [Yarrowia lipolytica]KAJ8054999.1 origin recognition complex, subunit 6 [Yarrowia lipolytica]QNP99566.1 Hypothetical protein YALI2_E00882g [Yarrowia lipolytica]|eukprot:XP_506105.1 YALI0F31647p [Yarrowia lipolytica CLIB122]